ncbi:MAG: sulfotransferase [Actinomycetota bacterium]
MARVLILGVPRSGTTWSGRALGATEGTSYVNEPDGFAEPYAFRIMLEHGEHPAIDPGLPAPDYERLWRGAFAGGRPADTVRDRAARFLYARTPVDARRAARSTHDLPPRLRAVRHLAAPLVADPEARHVVVKTVLACLSAEWLVRHCADARVLYVERHPYNVLSSWRDLGFVREGREYGRVATWAEARWGVTRPDTAAPHLARQTFFFAVLTAALRETAADHPEWVRTTHEHLCEDSGTRFAGLASTLGLEWGPRAATFVTESDLTDTQEAASAPDRPFRTRRATAEQPDRWRERLSPEERTIIDTTLAPFPFDVVPDEA